MRPISIQTLCLITELKAQYPNAELITFIRAHDGCRVFQDLGDRLEVESEAVEAGVRVILVKDTIAATKQAVRDWLGY